VTDKTVPVDGTGAAPCRPMRADARKNRDRILTAAECVFATEGVAVGMDEIARRAGVGVGTLYRHFPTKEALFEAIVLLRIGDLVRVAIRLQTSDDPVDALFAFLKAFSSEVAKKRDLSDALASAGVDIKAKAADFVKELEAAVGVLLRRAQDAGAVREDVSAKELFALAVGTCVAAEHTGLGPASTGRMLTVVLDGLRVPA
jgi:AcrR family transcriptional regulator